MLSKELMERIMRGEIAVFCATFEESLQFLIECKDNKASWRDGTPVLGELSELENDVVSDYAITFRFLPQYDDAFKQGLVRDSFSEIYDDEMSFIEYPYSEDVIETSNMDMDDYETYNI